jgi:hypothetical protein
MALPKYRIGLASMLLGILLARMAVHYASQAPGATPEQIWDSMSPTLQGVVLLGGVLLVYGLWTLGKALAHRLSGRPRA